MPTSVLRDRKHLHPEVAIPIRRDSFASLLQELLISPGDLRSLSAIARLLPTLACVEISGGPQPQIVISAETEALFHLFGPTVTPLGGTARRAATIEPTVQKPMNRVRTINQTPTSNSSALSSMRTSFRL